MNKEEPDIIIPEELYTRLENAVLEIPGVFAFTDEGFQLFKRNISQAFGLKSHKGLIISQNKRKEIRIDVSIDLKDGFQVKKIAGCIQETVKGIAAQYIEKDIAEINVTVTDIVKQKR